MDFVAIAPARGAGVGHSGVGPPCEGSPGSYDRSANTTYFETSSVAIGLRQPTESPGPGGRAALFTHGVALGLRPLARRGRRQLRLVFRGRCDRCVQGTYISQMTQSWARRGYARWCDPTRHFSRRLGLRAGSLRKPSISWPEDGAVEWSLKMSSTIRKPWNAWCMGGRTHGRLLLRGC
jgi:hypothetical protein